MLHVVGGRAPYRNGERHTRTAIALRDHARSRTALAFQDLTPLCTHIAGAFRKLFNLRLNLRLSAVRPVLSCWHNLPSLLPSKGCVLHQEINVLIPLTPIITTEFIARDSSSSC